MAMWGISAVGLIFDYRPPKRHTRLDHISVWQKLSHLDLIGAGLLAAGLLAAGLTLFLAGLGLGGNPWSWTSIRVLTTLTLGLAFILGFAFYEWKRTTAGILSHDLFRGGKEAGRSFAIYAGLIAVESLLLFAFIIFFPLL
jgi:heme/copper-type cytochrome/quinol oxidase subunit 3